MKMRLRHLVAVCLIGAAAWPGWSRAGDTYVIDPDLSSITFRIKHLGITFVYGIFPNACGAYTFDDADLANAAIRIKVKVADIDTGNERRDQHLRSPDFFDERHFPLIVFRSVAITSADDGQYRVTGELSLHGVTRPVTVQAVKTGFYREIGGDYRSGFETRFSIRRKDFGMDYMTTVADKVELFVSVEGIRIKDSISSSGERDETSLSMCE